MQNLIKKVKEMLLNVAGGT